MTKAWALISPSGKPITDTVRVAKWEAEQAAFDHLYAPLNWTAKYWKQWEAFIKERERRGWYVKRVVITLEAP